MTKMSSESILGDGFISAKIKETLILTLEENFNDFNDVKAMLAMLKILCKVQKFHDAISHGI